MHTCALLIWNGGLSAKFRFAGNVISALIMAILSSLRFSTESEQEENSEIEKMVSALTTRGAGEDEELDQIPTP